MTLATDENRFATDTPLQDYSSNTSLFPGDETIKANKLLFVETRTSAFSNRLIYFLLAVLFSLLVVLIITATFYFISTTQSKECTSKYGCVLNLNHELDTIL